MEELLEEVGVDAARFFFLMRGTSTHLDFDLDLAVARNEENPVYYVQYAHARICSILERASAEGLDVPLLIREADPTRLVEPEERTLLRLIADYPETVADAAASFEPQRLTTGLRELAAAFHPFYHRHRVLGAPDGLPAARLALCQGVRTTLANGLTLLGVSAPERM
jgi:arginyl-tRNA synthetase